MRAAKVCVPLLDVIQSDDMQGDRVRT